MDLNEQIAEAEKSLQRHLDWIGRHDTRIGFAAGITLAMLGVLANASASVLVWDCYTYFVFITPYLCLFGSLVAIFLSQNPQIEPPNASLIFFGTVGNLECTLFKKKFKEMTKEEFLDDLLFQIHINAQIISKKFKYLKTSFNLIAVAIPFWLLAIYFSQIYL